MDEIKVRVTPKQKKALKNLKKKEERQAKKNLDKIAGFIKEKLKEG